MKKIAAVLLAAVFCLPLFLFAVAVETPIKSIAEESVPDPTGVSAAVVYNLENDLYIYEYNADTVLAPASLVKLMTALCAYEALSERLDETITVEYSMIRDAVGNQVGYYVGETVPIRDLFAGLLVRGANDSALLLCHAADGGTAPFVERMNLKAQSLGMADTVLKNASGMAEEGMVTTARDMVKAARAFYEVEFLTELSGAVKYTMPATNKYGERLLYNRNALVSQVSETGYFDTRLTGLNAGSTSEAGYCTASAAQKENLTYIIIVMGGHYNEGEKNPAYTMASALCGYALEQFGYVEVISPGKLVYEIPVSLSADADYVTLVPAESLTLYLPRSLDIKTDLTYAYRLEYEVLEAPVTEGDAVGVYTVSKNGEILGSVELITKNSLPRSDFLSLLDSIDRFTHSVFFKAALLAALFLTVLYFVIRTIVRRARRRHGRYSRR